MSSASVVYNRKNLFIFSPQNIRHIDLNNRFKNKEKEGT
jgi:hypothetical protein